MTPPASSYVALMNGDDDEEREQALVRDFFSGRIGFFVEVGANHPTRGSQSWHLEERGWRGVVIEPQPDLAAELRKARSAEVFEVACSSKPGRATFHVAGTMSSLDPAGIVPGAPLSGTIEVEVRRLDDLLTEAGAPTPIDFLSLDVEGHEIEVLSGFDFARWRPRLILMEDHVANLGKHRFVTAAGYRLVRRTGFNGWYVPSDSTMRVSFADRWQVARKYYLALPFRMARDWSRARHQPFKDRRR